MGSVRQRLERQREQEEVVVETGGRRVALASSGPTMSVRNRADLAEAQNEAITPSTRSAGGTGFANGAVTRTRDRMTVEEASKPETARPRSQAEIDADEWLSLETRRQAEAMANQRPTVNAQERRIAEE